MSQLDMFVFGFGIGTSFTMIAFMALSYIGSFMLKKDEKVDDVASIIIKDMQKNLHMWRHEYTKDQSGDTFGCICRKIDLDDGEYSIIFSFLPNENKIKILKPIDVNKNIYLQKEDYDKLSNYVGDVIQYIYGNQTDWSKSKIKKILS